MTLKRSHSIKVNAKEKDAPSQSSQQQLNSWLIGLKLAPKAAESSSIHSMSHVKISLCDIEMAHKSPGSARARQAEDH